MTKEDLKNLLEKVSDHRFNAVFVADLADISVDKARKLLNQLVADGFLERTEEPLQGAVKRVWYSRKIEPVKDKSKRDEKLAKIFINKTFVSEMFVKDKDSLVDDLKDRYGTDVVINVKDTKEGYEVHIEIPLGEKG